MVITEPGLYVLDRSWRLLSPTLDGSIIINANDVILDLQGFELLGDSGVKSNGENVTIRNGRLIAGSGFAVEASGTGTVVDRIVARVDPGSGLNGSAVSIRGVRSMLVDSDISVLQATAVNAGDDTIVRDNRIESEFFAIRTATRTRVSGNDFQCGLYECVIVDGTDSIISRNKITARRVVGTGA